MTTLINSSSTCSTKAVTIPKYASDPNTNIGRLDPAGIKAALIIYF